ncbi:hypothetical protein SAMN05192588_1121 [Nonlabens sp. Hel1_33_55]|uniref:hypothetical protein n=1 Tax=Nonlabens sp. Hel1_33_55 TaxID=1336802 RepID=UPI000875B3B4|nr:hypothetical protein [Nonlabens sp. Hel1_33_55]SCY09534.1 hypothetical protein SAMN05192588_1121 [Nonlabens sp. Hel1_33_55]
MRNHLIKLTQPCSEDWNEMNSTKNGEFCVSCSKDVLDLTNIESETILKIFSSKKDLCCKIHKEQLQAPNVEINEWDNSQTSYSTYFAAILLASAISISHPIEAKENLLPMEIIKSTSSSEAISHSAKSRIIASPVQKQDSIHFEAIVIFESDGKPIENADVMFVSANLILKTKTNDDGSFSLKIPLELIDDQNLFRISHVNSLPHSGITERFDTKNYILSKKSMSTKYQFNVPAVITYLGGAYYIKNAPDPVVLYKGSEISYKHFDKALDGKNKKFDMTNKGYYFFDENDGVAIYGNRAYYGIYLVYDK